MAKSSKNTTETSVDSAFQKITEISDAVIAEVTTEAAPEVVEEVQAPEVVEEVQAPEVEPEATPAPEVEPEATEEIVEVEPEATPAPEVEPEATPAPEVEPEATEEIVEDELSDDDKIAKILVSQNYYSHLKCGSHLKEEITEEILSVFYDEFISYGIFCKEDSDLIALLKKKLNK